MNLVVILVVKVKMQLYKSYKQKIKGAGGRANSGIIVIVEL